ncbi:DUF397 domain-containing protein [Streptomyces sp. URMC 129]|uniref:DUF397 domain-containing protein n=1 Tax=Streptomyces sp. URMC 129 TaxID=3423407 RepID=UPI003F1E0F19
MTAERLVWFTSSYSGPNGGDCVEVAAGAVAVHVRDSKDAAGARLRFPRGGWAAFLAIEQVRAGRSG